MKKVPSVYTHSMKTIHLLLSAQVAEGTSFMKSPVTQDYTNIHGINVLLVSIIVLAKDHKSNNDHFFDV